MSNNNYCCADMKFAITRKTVGAGKGLFIYDPIKRSYGIVINNNIENQFFLSYCPFCGEKLPEDLCDEYFDAIREPNTGKVIDPLPEEFKTDEWWKKRSL